MPVAVCIIQEKGSRDVLASSGPWGAFVVISATATYSSCSDVCGVLSTRTEVPRMANKLPGSGRSMGMLEISTNNGLGGVWLEDGLRGCLTRPMTGPMGWQPASQGSSRCFQRCGQRGSKRGRCHPPATGGVGGSRGWVLGGLPHESQYHGSGLVGSRIMAPDPDGAAPGMDGGWMGDGVVAP